jgi:adenylate cyclase
MNAWLETKFGDRIQIHGNCSLGRDAGNTLVLPGHQVSRRHATIHIQGKDEYWLVDLGSRNGVFIHGHRVTMPVALTDNDRLEIGGNALTFHQQKDPASAQQEQDTSTDDRTVPASRTSNLWLLIADIEKFTPLSQSMPGDQLAKLVGGWIGSCKEIVEAHDGEINQYLGDGFLAYWPAPDTDASVISSTLRQLSALGGSGPLKFRLIVHHGAVTVDFALSSGKNSLIGQEVNYVFRMEKIAGGMGIHCMATASAAKLLQPHATQKSLGRHELKGFEGDHESFEIFLKP